MKLQQIDELTRPNHSFLAPDDHCFFLREYTAGAGYEHGETNNLISNLKKKVDRRGRPEWVHKERAIQRAGQELRQVLDHRCFATTSIVSRSCRCHPRASRRTQCTTIACGGSSTQ